MPDAVRPRALLALDFETTGVIDTNEYDRISILEVGAKLISFDLDILDSYLGVIKMDETIAARLKQPENKIALEMHRANGLLREAVGGTDVETPEGTVHIDPLSLEETETELLEMLEQSGFKPGELILSGAGIASYDYPLIKQHMPRLKAWLTYFTVDISVLKRGINLFAGKKIIGGANASGPGAAHRSMPDVDHAIEEARQIRGFVRAAADALNY